MNSKEIIVEKLKRWIKETNVIDYDESINSLGWDKGFKVYDKKLEILRDGKTQREVYLVSFKTNDKETFNSEGEIEMFVEGMYCFAYFDAETLNLLYIHKKAGYIEVDGKY